MFVKDKQEVKNICAAVSNTQSAITFIFYIPLVENVHRCEKVSIINN